MAISRKYGEEFINFVEIEGICDMHHWLRGNGRPCYQTRNFLGGNIHWPNTRDTL